LGETYPGLPGEPRRQSHDHGNKAGKGVSWGATHTEGMGTRRPIETPHFPPPPPYGRGVFDMTQGTLDGGGYVASLEESALLGGVFLNDFMTFFMTF